MRITESEFLKGPAYNAPFVLRDRRPYGVWLVNSGADAIVAAQKICLLRAVVFPMVLQHDVQIQQNGPMQSSGNAIATPVCETPVVQEHV